MKKEIKSVRELISCLLDMCYSLPKGYKIVKEGEKKWRSLLVF